MKHLTALLVLTVAFAGCKDEQKTDTPTAEAPTWTAEVRELDTTTDGHILVKTPSADDFAPWRGGQPIPAGSTVRTPKTVRATLTLPRDGELALNHSTTVTLASESRLQLESGQAVLEFPPAAGDGAGEYTVGLPAGEVILHGTKVGLVASEKESTVTITQGMVEVRHGAESFEGRAGQEIVLRHGAAPVVTQSPDLGRRIGWSEFGERAVSETLPEVPRGLGKLVGKTPGGETEHRLDLVNHKVEVKIQGNLAYTEITESFKNPVGQTLEGVYRFPLPSDARISRLSLKVGNTWMEGEFLETARAERIWRDVIDQWRDPAMLKWKEGNTFELRIFPIDPHQTREVKIGYVQRLQPSSSGYTYTYPMPMDRAGLIPAGQFEFVGQVYGHDATQTLEMLGYAGQVETGATEQDQAFAKISFSERDFVARGDLSVRFGRRDAAGMRAYSYGGVKGKDPYAVFVVRPELPARAEIKPRDFVIVVDKSLSRTGAALQVQKHLVPRMIREMDPLDRVAVVACNERCDEIAPKFEFARLAHADDVQSKLLDVDAAGATYPVEAVRVAADLFRRRADTKREAHVVYFTDGIASVGELRPGKLSEAVQRTLSPFDARMSVVDIGGNMDAMILDALATAGRGRVVSLDPMLSMTGQALDILGAHYREVLERPTLTLPAGVTANVRLPNAIAAGDEVVIAARFKGDVKGDLVLTGQMNGAPHTVRYPLELKAVAGKGNRFVPGEWAAQRIATLELDAGDHEKEIVALSKTYGVLSRYTTLLALESKEMMDEFGVRARDRVQWTGDEVAEEASVDEEPPAPTSRPRPAPQRQATKSKSGSGRAVDLWDSSAKDSNVESKKRRPASAPPKHDFEGLDMIAPPPRRHRMPRTPRPRVPTLQTSDAKPVTTWEQNNVERRRKLLASDPNNRTKRMRLIRAMLRADEITAARTETHDWLQTNPFDPEAIVQLAQIEAQDGDLDAFYTRLISAADAAPRGRWLQERIEAAARAQGDEPLACAFGVALESTAKRAPKTPADILACPMTTNVGTWFGEPGPSSMAPPVDSTRPSGRVVLELTSSGGDWDLVLLEPDGRPLWWGSARRNVKFANVVGTDRTEVLALPSLRSGTYSVRAVPRSGKAGDVLQLEVRGDGTRRNFAVTAPHAKAVEIAEFELR